MAENNTNTNSVPEGAPPSYEQSLQHRRVEQSTYNVPDYPRDGAYPGPPRAPRPTNSARMRRFRFPSASFTRSVSPVVVRDPEAAQEDDDEEDEGKWGINKLVLPPMHMCIAITCLIFNIVVPGTGTMLAGLGVFCCTKSDEWGITNKFKSFGLSMCMGVFQLALLPVLLIGWIWSIMWGFALLGVSLELYHGVKVDGEEASTSRERGDSISVDGRRSSNSSDTSSDDGDDEERNRPTRNRTTYHARTDSTSTYPDTELQSRSSLQSPFSDITSQRDTADTQSEVTVVESNQNSTPADVHTHNSSVQAPPRPAAIQSAESSTQDTVQPSVHSVQVNTSNRTSSYGASPPPSYEVATGMAVADVDSP